MDPEKPLQKQVLNAEAKEWYPSSHKQHFCNGFRSTSVQQVDKPNEFVSLEDMIMKMTYDPGYFEDIIDVFMQTLNICVHNDELMMKMCDFIIEHAIAESCFRYNAARLCVLMHEESLFYRQYLHERCLREVEKNRQRPGFSVFLAELCTQLANNWKMLYDALNKLLSIGGDENVKTVCQCLKLAGFNLERFNKLIMDDLIIALIACKTNVQKAVSSLIDTVVHLKSINWGHNAESTPHTQQYSMENDEMCAFDLDCLDDPDGLFNPEPEMDEEIQAAFKEFVQMAK